MSLGRRLHDGEAERSAPVQPSCATFSDRDLLGEGEPVELGDETEQNDARCAVLEAVIDLVIESIEPDRSAFIEEAEENRE